MWPFFCELENDKNQQQNPLVCYDPPPQFKRELHDTYAAPGEFVEVGSIHGYRSLMWVGEAKEALGRLRDKIISETLVEELVDDILENMLEGWAFGERESDYTVAGYVPSIKVFRESTHNRLTPQSQINQGLYVRGRERE